MKSTTQNIPDYLIYEIYKGKPIHYKGYKQVLKGKKRLEEIRCRPYIQSLIISRLIFLLMNNLRPEFEVLSSEVGLKFGKNYRRAADIAIYEKAQLKKIKDENKILEIPPKYVIEVDIKVAKEDIEDSTSYYHHKIDELLRFGVEYVVWIFTTSKKILLVQKGKKNWEITDWTETFNIIEGIEINIEKFLK